MLKERELCCEWWPGRRLSFAWSRFETVKVRAGTRLSSLKHTGFALVEVSRGCQPRRLKAAVGMKVIQISYEAHCIDEGRRLGWNPEAVGGRAGDQP